MPNLFVPPHSPSGKLRQPTDISAYLDPPKILFLLALCYMIPILSFGEYQAYLAQRILVIVIIFLGLASHIRSKKLERFSEEIKAFLGFSAYILVLVWRMKNQNQPEPISEPVADITFYAIMSANLERILIFTFMKSKIALVMNITAIICRYAMFRPEKTLTIVISAIGDAIILGYTFVHFRILNTKNKSETHFEEKENDSLEMIFSNIYTPLVFLDVGTMKPIFHNKEMVDILDNLSLSISDFVETLLAKMDHEHIDDIFNSSESPSSQGLQRQKKFSYTNEMTGNIKGKNGCGLTCNIKVTKGNFSGKEILFVQLKDLSFQEKTKTLEASIAYKDHVLNTVAHDLRNPLGAITGILKHLENTTKDQHIKDFIKTCMTIGELLVNILNTYLDGAQIKNNKIRLVPAEINMKEYLKDLFKIFNFLCKQKNISFSIKIKSSIPGVIFSDQHRITQVLINLVSNAIKFTPNGNISLVISANYDSEDTCPLLNFAVTDTGVGISEENQQKLFQAFSKLDGDSKLNPYGVGLGLIISNDLVSLLNKAHPKECIRVESALNKGSTFSFTISSMLETAASLRPSRSENLNESFVSRISSDEHSLSSDTANAIEAKVLDYSKDYGRLNGSKFHIPKEKKDSPKSFSLLLENTSFEALKNPRSPVMSPGPSKWKTLAPAKLKSETTIQAKTYTYAKSTSLVDTNGKFSNFLNNALLETQKRLVSMDRVKTPVSRTQLNPEECYPVIILVVDDDPFNILAVSPGLMEKGFEVTYAMNGEDCIQNVKEKAKEKVFFEAILMDCDMPVMNGFEATKILVEMMKNKDIPKVPIVGLTGSEDEETINKCKEVGMVGVIGKPFQEQKLYEILKI